MLRQCDICGKTIDPERLAILPTTQRCVDCSREKGSDVMIMKPIEQLFDSDTYRDLLDSISD